MTDDPRFERVTVQSIAGDAAGAGGYRLGAMVGGDAWSASVLTWRAARFARRLQSHGVCVFGEGVSRCEGVFRRYGDLVWRVDLRQGIPVTIDGVEFVVSRRRYWRIRPSHRRVEIDGPELRFTLEAAAPRGVRLLRGDRTVVARIGGRRTEVLRNATPVERAVVCLVLSQRMGLLVMSPLPVALWFNWPWYAFGEHFV